MISHRGMSLVEALIAIGLLGGAALGFMKLFDNANKGHKTSEIRMEAMEIRRLISTTLMDKEACEQTFINKKIGDPVDAIKNSAGSNIFESGKSYSNNQIKISSMTTVDRNQVNSDGSRIIDLVIKHEQAKGKGYSQLKDARFVLNVVTDENGVIVGCFNDAQQTIKQACLSLGGDWKGAECELPGCPDGQTLQKINADGTATCKWVVAPTRVAGDNCVATDSNVAVDNQGALMSCRQGKWASSGGALEVIFNEQRASGGNFTFTTTRRALVLVDSWSFVKTSGTRTPYTNISINGTNCVRNRGDESHSDRYTSASCARIIEPGSHTVSTSSSYVRGSSVVVLGI